MEIYLILILFVIGIANGFYSGLLGTGGNVILIPAFDIVLGILGVPESEIVQFIIAHSLFVTIFNGSLVSFGHYKHGNIAFDRVFQIAIPAIAAGYLVTHFIKTSSWYQKTTFDWIFLGLVILITIRYLFFRSTNRMEQDQPALLNHFGAYSVLGLFTGVTTALSGFGGGTVVIPSLTDIFGFPIRKASSVSIGVVTLLAIGITISYLQAPEASHATTELPLQFGYISMGLVLPILAGISFAAPWGVRVARRTKPHTLRLIFGFVMLAILFKTIYDLS